MLHEVINYIAVVLYPKLTMDFMRLLMPVSSNALQISSSDVSNSGFCAVLLVCLKLLLWIHTHTHTHTHTLVWAYTLTSSWWDCIYDDIWSLIVTVFAKPPSEPKLSQLSSEQEEEEVSMGTSGTLRKLLKLILVDGGGWTASLCEWKQAGWANRSPFYKPWLRQEGLTSLSNYSSTWSKSMLWYLVGF